MSSDSGLSLRWPTKDRLKNLTLSLQRNPTSSNLNTSRLEGWFGMREMIKNLTGQHIPGLIFGPDEDKGNTTIAEGFLDSLFHTETANETYFKVLIICLWIIAFLLILFTLPNLLLPAKRTNAKLIRFHVYLCELFYLIYILLSMINVAMHFQLQSTLCDLANHGMYVTIPILHVALFLLSIERAVSYSGSGTILSKLVARSCVTQTILWFLWALSIVVTIAWLTFKNHFTRILFENQFASVLRLAVDEIVNQLGRRSYRCSIDGRLPAGFKIVLSILFILLVVVIVKALIISTGVQCLIPSCCQRKKANRNQHRSRATLSLIAILLLNVFFSLPFYAASIFTSVFSKFDWSKATFSKILRILFLLRLLSIVFQCLVFYLLDEEPCPLVTKCINCAIGPGRHPSQATRQRVNNSGQSLVAKLKRKDQANDGTYAQINPTTRRKPVSRRKMTVKDLSEIDSTEAVFVANRSVETRSADEIVDETKVVTLKSKASNKPAPLELPTQKKRRVDGNNSDDLYANSLLVRTTCDDSTVSSSSERLATPPIRKKRVRSASSRSKRMTKTHLSTVSPKSPATKSPSRSNRDVLNDENSDV